MLTAVPEGMVIDLSPAAAAAEASALSLGLLEHATDTIKNRAMAETTIERLYTCTSRLRRLIVARTWWLPRQAKGQGAGNGGNCTGLCRLGCTSEVRRRNAY